MKVKVKAILIDMSEKELQYTFEEIKSEITRVLTKELYLDNELLEIEEIK